MASNNLQNPDFNEVVSVIKRIVREFAEGAIWIREFVHQFESSGFGEEIARIEQRYDSGLVRFILASVAFLRHVNMAAASTNRLLTAQVVTA